jgi:L-ornithine Nalpha-acyltransferase
MTKKLRLEKNGNLEVRLANTLNEVKRAQRVRWKVFYKEMNAVASPLTKIFRLDVDNYDALCDHILVLDHDKKKILPFGKKRPKVVGTYRLLRQEKIKEAKAFYSANEFDISPLIDNHKDLRFLELGRSCVLKDYRNKRTIELLWAGIFEYVQRNDVDVMVGCASFPETDIEIIKEQLSFIYHYARAEGEWAVSALPDKRIDMNLVNKEDLKEKNILAQMPPLIKAYMRLGARFGDSAVIDKQFGTTDVFVILPKNQMSEKYIKHFS